MISLSHGLLALTLATPVAPTHDIVDTALAAGNFKTLATALTEADLVGALKGDGPFTVFAPTDEAFAAIPKKTLANLLRPENRDQLTAILTYHVVPGRVPASKVVGLTAATTLNGQRVQIQADSNGVRLDKAQVIKTDIECSNGIIHVIDTVLMPETRNLVEVAAEAGSFETLLAAAKSAGLAEALSGEGPFTVFAPTDEAFAKLPKGTVQELLKKENQQKLVSILSYHVIPDLVYSGQAIADGRGTTLQKDELRFTLADGRFKVNNSNVVANDLQTSNGVIHVIDAVLLPPEPQPKGRKIIGVYTGSVSNALAAQLGINRGEALLVSRLTSGGNAEKSGLKKYDVITAIDGNPATDRTLAQAKEMRGFGGKVRLEVVRMGKKMEYDVEVGVDTH